MDLKDKSVIILGSANGKTTLADRIQATYGQRRVTEYGAQKGALLGLGFGCEKPVVMAVQHHVPKEFLLTAVTGRDKKVVVVTLLRPEARRTPLAGCALTLEARGHIRRNETHFVAIFSKFTDPAWAALHAALGLELDAAPAQVSA